MRVLLLSYNHTVQEMVRLALQKMSEIELVLAQAADQVEPTTYDLIFVDDALPLYQESIALIQTLGIEAIVLLAQESNTEANHFARVLRKPFLPSEIHALAEEQYNKQDHRSPKKFSQKNTEKKHTRKHKKKKNKHHIRTQTEVLDLDEIETIKALLEEEGLEIIHEEELAENVISNPSSPSDRHEALIHALRTMKPKKIRKLLKGATVRINITFPKES